MRRTLQSIAALPMPRQRYADGGVVQFGSRGVAGLRDLIPKMQAMGYPQAAPAPAPAEASGAARLRAMIPQMEAMGYKQEPQHLARGGHVRGPGTGTSDSIPAMLSDGEFVIPADTVRKVGVRRLQDLVDSTHKYVGSSRPGQFANGGMVDDEVTRVGNSYSGGNVGGNVSINGQTGGGTVSTTSWTSPVPAPAPTPVATAAPTAQQPAAAPATTAATPAPAPAPAAPMGWAERNAQRNTQVTASSIMDSPERRAAQSALAPVPQQPVPAAAPQPPVGGLRGVAQRTAPLSPYTTQPQRFANGGLAKEDERPGGGAVFGLYPQLTDNQRTTHATGDKLRSGVVATGPRAFAPALNPAPPAPAPIRGGGDGRRMNATQDPRSLTYGGAAVTAIPSAPAGVQASVPSDSQMEAPDVRPVQQPTAQSSGAAERLSLQQIADNTAPQAVAAPTVVHSGNDWAARKRLENLATAASSITNDRRWGGDGERSQDRQAYQQALATDASLQASAPQMQQTAMREAGATTRANVRAQLDGATNQIAGERLSLEKIAAGYSNRSADRLDRAQAELESAKTPEAQKSARERLMALAGKAPQNEWGVQVTPATKNLDGSTTQGSIYRYNKTTGETVRVDEGQGRGDISTDQRALAIRNNANLSLDQKRAELQRLGYAR